MSKIPNELQVQKTILDWLENNNISPFSIIFTYAGNTGGTLSITFYMSYDLDDFLRLMDYKSRCDKSGYYVNRKENTVILQDLALVGLYSLL